MVYARPAASMWRASAEPAGPRRGGRSGLRRRRRNELHDPRRPIDGALGSTTSPRDAPRGRVQKSRYARRSRPCRGPIGADGGGRPGARAGRAQRRAVPSAHVRRALAAATLVRRHAPVRRRHALVRRRRALVRRRHAPPRAAAARRSVGLATEATAKHWCDDQLKPPRIAPATAVVAIRHRRARRSRRAVLDRAGPRSRPRVLATDRIEGPSSDPTDGESGRATRDFPELLGRSASRERAGRRSRRPLSASDSVEVHPVV